MADYDSSLPIRTETDGDVVSKIVGDASGNIAEVNVSNEQLVTDAGATTAIGAVETAVAAVEADVAAVNTAQTDGSQKTQVVDGTGDILSVNADGSINVVVQDEGAVDGEVHEYGTASGGVPGTENTVIDYTVTALKTLRLKSIQVSASGKFKFELKVGPATTEVTQAVGFGSTATGTVQITFPQPIEVDAGNKVLLLITNNDKANADLYGFINGIEV